MIHFFLVAWHSMLSMVDKVTAAMSKGDQKVTHPKTTEKQQSNGCGLHVRLHPCIEITVWLYMALHGPMAWTWQYMGMWSHALGQQKYWSNMCSPLAWLSSICSYKLLWFIQTSPSDMREPTYVLERLHAGQWRPTLQHFAACQCYHVPNTLHGFPLRTIAWHDNTWSMAPWQAYEAFRLDMSFQNSNENPFLSLHSPLLKVYCLWTNQSCMHEAHNSLLLEMTFQEVHCISLFAHAWQHFPMTTSLTS